MMLKTESKNPSKRFPSWLRQSIRFDENVDKVKQTLDFLNINTVCRSARCPNIYDCFARKHCTFLILGNICTRNCGFCAVLSNKNGQPPDKKEIFRIKEAVKRIGLKKVIITSVTRDDLPDGGAGYFAECILSLRGACELEALVPDFLGDKYQIEKIVSAKPDIFAHNMETVQRLYKKVRPQADYSRSLDVLRYAKDLVTKSSLMAGLGEKKEEVYDVMKDLREVGCDIITVGQYLKPDPSCLDVEEFIHPDVFRQFSQWAEELGFKKYSCSPFSRSSYW